MENLLRLSAILRARAFWYDLMLLHSYFYKERQDYRILTNLL